MASNNTPDALANTGNVALYLAAPTTLTRSPAIEFVAIESHYRVLNAVREVIGNFGQDVAVINMSENYWIRTA